jgi:hypothetical protein
MAYDKFEDFDKALLAQVRAGKGTMRELNTDASGLRELAWPVARPGLLSRPLPPPRVIADRLQVLAQRGAIRHNGKAWVAISK